MDMGKVKIVQREVCTDWDPSVWCVHYSQGHKARPRSLAIHSLSEESGGQPLPDGSVCGG